MIIRLLPVALLTLAAHPALAHLTGHEQMSMLELARHLTEPDHLALFGAAAAAGWLAWRWGRRIEARRRVAGKPGQEPRP